MTGRPTVELIDALRGPSWQIRIDRTDAAQVLAELLWVVNSSEGVVGLNADGSVMSWAEVISLYAPSVKP